MTTIGNNFDPDFWEILTQLVMMLAVIVLLLAVFGIYGLISITDFINLWWL